MYFDVAMPLTLFAVTVVSLFLNRKVERKLRSTFEEREFRIRDVILLVVSISVMVSLIVLIPQMFLMIMFLFSYSVLLFIFTYLFSDFGRMRAKTFVSLLLVASFTVATLSLINFGANGILAYGALALYSLFGLTFLVLLYEETRTHTGERWYLAVLPPTFFLCLYMFFRMTPLWFPYLLNLFGALFSILIVVYMSSLFTWKTFLFFTSVLTFVDVILVLFTGSMVSAAQHVSSLRLPILMSMPTVPAILTRFGVLYVSLGLGDFFFAGLIATQSQKRFGDHFAVLSIIAMSISFFLFEAFMLNYEWRALPGTVMIVAGWIPLILWKKNVSRRR